jgi:hypothetical protein
LFTPPNPRIVPTLPWLILADAGQRVVAEGFAQDHLVAQIKRLTP